MYTKTNSKKTVRTINNKWNDVKVTITRPEQSWWKNKKSGSWIFLQRKLAKFCSNIYQVSQKDVEKCFWSDETKGKIPKLFITTKAMHTHGEAWWWQHHALGAFSSGWARALVKVEGILSSFKHHCVLAKTVKFMLESILAFSVPKTESIQIKKRKAWLEED